MIESVVRNLQIIMITAKEALALRSFIRDYLFRALRPMLFIMAE